MYRMLVVDDKRIERRGIAFLVAEYSLPIEVIERENGVAALEYLRENPVDILFTDIRMPIGDGLTLAAQARALYPQLLIVIFSAYSEFDYAKRALSLGAFRYLLKPIDIKEFLQVIGDATALLAARQEQQVTPTMVVEQTLRRLIGGQQDAAALQAADACLAQYGLPVGRQPACFMLATRPEGFDMAGVTHLQEALAECFLDPGFTLQLKPDVVACLLMVNPMQQSAQALRKAGQQLQQQYTAQTGAQLQLILGQPFEGADKLYDAYCQVETLAKSAFYASKNSILQQPDHPQQMGDALQTVLQDLDARLAEDDPGAAGECLDMLFDQLQASEAPSATYAKFLCAQLVTRLCVKYGVEQTAMAQLVEEVFAARSLEEMRQVATQACNRLQQRPEQTEAASARLVNEVCGLVARNYMQDISVDSLARQVYRSPTYLSRVFKRVTGESLSKYITRYRLERAAELLGRQEIMVSEVARRCGYQDYSYFGMLFRQQYGVTPSAYRRSLLQGENHG